MSSNNDATFDNVTVNDTLTVNKSTKLIGQFALDGEGVKFGGNGDLQEIKTKSQAIEESYEHDKHDKKTMNKEYTENNTSESAKFTTNNNVEISNHNSRDATLTKNSGKINKVTFCSEWKASDKTDKSTSHKVRQNCIRSFEADTFKRHSTIRSVEEKHTAGDFTQNLKSSKSHISNTCDDCNQSYKRGKSVMSIETGECSVTKTRNILNKSGSVTSNATISKDAHDINLKKHAKTVYSVKSADKVITRKVRKTVDTHRECGDSVSVKKAKSRVMTSEISNNKYSASRNKIVADVNIANGVSKDVLIGDTSKVEIVRAVNNRVGKVLTDKSAFSLTKVEDVAMYKQFGAKLYQFIAGDDKAEWNRVPEDKALLLKAYFADVKSDLRK